MKPVKTSKRTCFVSISKGHGDFNKHFYFFYAYIKSIIRIIVSKQKFQDKTENLYESTPFQKLLPCLLASVLCTQLSLARLAQSVEHQTFNLRVKGSSPSSGLNFFYTITRHLVTRTIILLLLIDKNDVINFEMLICS